MPHRPARWPLYGRLELSRLLKVDHIYVAHAHKAALGRLRVIASGYRLCGGGGSQELRAPVHDGRYGLPDTDVDMSRFEGRNTRLSPRVFEGPPHGFNDVYRGFEELWRIMAWVRHRKRGPLPANVRGVSRCHVPFEKALLTPRPHFTGLDGHIEPG